MREVSVLFTTPKVFHWSSYFLKTKFFGMGTPFSHVCLKIHSHAYDSTLIYEANGHGIRAEEFENWSGKNKIIHQHTFIVSDDRKLEIIKFCIKHLGIQYGYGTIVFLWLRDKLSIVLNSGRDGAKTFICSEFAYYMLKNEVDALYSRIQRPLPPSLDEMHPRELYQALLEAKEELKTEESKSSKLA